MSLAPSSLQHVQPVATRSIRNLLEGVSDPTLLVSGELSVLYANAESRLRFGQHSVSEGVSFADFLRGNFADTAWDEIEEALNRLLEEPGAEPARFFLGTGLKQSHMRVSVLEFPDSPLMLSVTFFEPDADVLMRRVELVLDSSTDGIFIVNRSNHIVFFNKACEKLTGWQRNAPAMQTYECSNVLRCHNEHGDSLGSEQLCPAKVFFQRETEPKPHEMLVTTTAGKKRYVETNYSPIRNAAGEVEFIVGIIRDIDERKRLERQVAQNRNLVMLGQLVSGIAHEIKNPLGILMSSVEIVLNEKRPPEQRREAATYIKEEVRRLDDRMKDFLAFARPRALRLEPVDVGALLRRTAASYQGALSNRRFHVVPQMCAHTPTTLADPDLLHQVFLNLIINADQAMPRGGILTITAETVEDRIHVRFVDNGTGIGEEDLPKLFDPFFTTKAEGTGLGLSVVQQIVMAHGGQISVSNNKEKAGCTFLVDLPITKEQETF